MAVAWAIRQLQHHGDWRQFGDLRALSKAHPRPGARLPARRRADRVVASAATAPSADQRVESRIYPFERPQLPIR
jgi:hypothetical protein